MQLEFANSDALQEVSIRARPGGRAMPTTHDEIVCLVHVSIRARPGGRAMPRLLSRRLFNGSCFNPRPPWRTGDAARSYAVSMV